MNDYNFNSLLFCKLQDCQIRKVGVCIEQLKENAKRLKDECHSVYLDSKNGVVDHATLTQRIIQGAYDVAKATKQIVTLYQ